MVEIIKLIFRITISDGTTGNISRKSVLSKLILNVNFKVFAVHNMYVINS